MAVSGNGLSVFFLKFFDPLCEFLLQEGFIGEIKAVFGSINIFTIR
jgi:hypothetical protein